MREIIDTFATLADFARRGEDPPVLTHAGLRCSLRRTISGWTASISVTVTDIRARKIARLVANGKACIHANPVLACDNLIAELS